MITGSNVESTNGNFTPLYFLDGDMGLQDFYYVSAFSLSSALAMTWDRDAIYEQAKAVGSEFYNKGVQVVAGPTSQPLGRTPWGGRGVEGFGPDPYLNGLATGLTTKGYVDAGVIPGGKVRYTFLIPGHFVIYLYAIRVSIALPLIRARNQQDLQFWKQRRRLSLLLQCG